MRSRRRRQCSLVHSVSSPPPSWLVITAQTYQILRYVLLKYCTYFSKKNIFLQHDYCLNISINVHSVSSTPSSWLVITEQISHLFCPKPLFFCSFFLVLAKHLIYFLSPKILVICIFVLVLPKYCVLFPIITFLHNFLCFAQISLLCV